MSKKPLQEPVVEAVHAAIDELNEQLPKAERLKKCDGTVLLGEAGSLDSLRLITLLVAAEREMDVRCGLSVDLINQTENALSDTESPLRTVGSLIAHLESLSASH